MRVPAERLERRTDRRDRGRRDRGAAPGSNTPWDFYELAEGGIPLGGPGHEGYALDDGVLFRSGGLAVGIVVHTGEGKDTDRALALEIAGIAADGLPTSR